MKQRNVYAIVLLFCLVLFNCFLGKSVCETFSDTNGENASVYKSQIPIGDEDLYILKSQIVPPVCPACPDIISCGSKEPPPPCPACARCPEPSFDCKRVPNYNSAAINQYLPQPVLADFSQFGM